MRKAIKWTIYGCYALLSLSAFERIADSFGRVEWLKAMLATHPILHDIIMGPMFPLLCLGLAIVAVEGRKFIKRPELHIEAERIKFISDLGAIPLSMIDEIHKTKDYKLDVDVFIRVHITNTEHPVVIRRFDGKLILRKRKHFDIPTTYRITDSPDWTGYTSRENKKVTTGGVVTVENVYHPPDVLLEKIHNVPLCDGKGYKGWIKMRAKDVSRKQLEDYKITQVKFTAIDTLGNSHTTILKDRQAMDDSGEEIIPPI